MRRIFIRLQGAPRGAYYIYLTFGATLKADKKTGKIVDIFVPEALRLTGSNLNRLQCFWGVFFSFAYFGYKFTSFFKVNGIG